MSLTVYLEDPETGEELYSANITHNLGKMAGKANIYEALWRPLETGIKTGADVAKHLEPGLKMLVANPGYFRQFNSPNGWGIYDHFVPFVSGYLQACKDNPEAIVSVSR